MRKRIGALLLIFALLSSLSACGGQKQDSALSLSELSEMIQETDGGEGNHETRQTEESTGESAESRYDTAEETAEIPAQEITEAEEESTGTYEAFTYSIVNSEAVITDVSLGIDGEITIPSEIEGYPVTKIGDYAFHNAERMTGVVIPDSVVSIGERAFANCRRLENIQFGSGVTDIGAYAFVECESLRSVVIPEGVASMGRGAFARCSMLWNVDLPSSLKSIECFAFYQCQLQDVVIKEGTEQIDMTAFYDCDLRLTSITIPASVTTIYSSSLELDGEQVIDYHLEDCPDVMIYCYGGSAAEAWARTWGVSYTVIE